MGVLRVFKPKSSWQSVILAVAVTLTFLLGVQYGKYSMETGPQVVAGREAAGRQGADEPEQQKMIKVHVAGAVFKSGMYELKSGSRVNDLIQKAIALPDADLDRLNLAMSLKDGKQIYVHSKEEKGRETGALNPLQHEKEGEIRINSCSAEKLQELPGIGPALAARIIQYRTQNGPFNSVEDLQNVSGIGDKKMEAIKDLVTVY